MPWILLWWTLPTYYCSFELILIFFHVDRDGLSISRLNETGFRQRTLTYWSMTFIFCHIFAIGYYIWVVKHLNRKEKDGAKVLDDKSVAPDLDYVKMKNETQ